MNKIKSFLNSVEKKLTKKFLPIIIFLLALTHLLMIINFNFNFNFTFNVNIINLIIVHLSYYTILI